MSLYFVYLMEIIHNMIYFHSISKDQLISREVKTKFDLWWLGFVNCKIETFKRLFILTSMRLGLEVEQSIWLISSLIMQGGINLKAISA